MKKATYFIYLIILLATPALCQQDPLFVLSYQNLLYLNPSIAGSEEMCNTSFFFRKQWTGLRGSPESILFSFDSPFNYQRMGVGLNVMRETIVAEEKLYVNGCYSYKINLGRGKLSFGAYLGLAQHKLDFHNLKIQDLDDKLLKEMNSKLSPDIGAGFLYKQPSLSVGISSTHINKTYTGYLNSEISTGKINRHFYGHISKDFLLSTNLQLNTTIVALYSSSKNYDFTGGCVFTFKEAFKVGGFYRNNGILAGNIGLTLDKINNALQNLWINYAYEFQTFSKERILLNTHELMLAYHFNWPQKLSNIKNKPTPLSPVDF